MIEKLTEGLKFKSRARQTLHSVAKRFATASTLSNYCVALALCRGDWHRKFATRFALDSEYEESSVFSLY